MFITRYLEIEKLPKLEGKYLLATKVHAVQDILWHNLVGHKILDSENLWVHRFAKCLYVKRIGLEWIEPKMEIILDYLSKFGKVNEQKVKEEIKFLKKIHFSNG